MASAAAAVPRLVRRCGGGCDGREDAAVEAMLQWQKVSDLLIAASLLSIPLELLYFATCAALAPLRRVLLQLVTFIVMCGVTHLLNVLAYDRPGSRPLLLALTSAKLLGALATTAAAVSLPALFPRLLRVKFRESFLRTKARQLGRDLAAVRRREDAVWRVVRAVAHHVRDAVDARTILRTTMLHLADALRLTNCAVWTPVPPHRGACDGDGVLQLTHQLLPDEHDKVAALDGGGARAISVRDPDVAAVLASKDAKVLRPGSALKAASGGGPPLAGPAAAIRIPNFHTAGSSAPPGLASCAILVLVLRAEDDGGHHTGWSNQDLEIVQAVADQVAVALSHAAALEESQLIRHKLAEQHGALMRAKSELAAATKARNAARGAVHSAMERSMHAVVGLVSVVQQEAAATMRPEQRLAVDAIARTSAVSNTLMDDVMEILSSSSTTTTDCRDRDTPLSVPTIVARRPFELRSLVRDAASAAGCVCNNIIGDDQDLVPVQARPSFTGGGNHVFVKFQVGISRSPAEGDPAGSLPTSSRPPPCVLAPDSGGADMQQCIAMRKKIVQMMNGDMWWASECEGLGETMTLILRFQLQQSLNRQVPGSGTYQIGVPSSTTAPPHHFNGLRILLVDSDATSQEVTRKLLERLGCEVLAAWWAADCLSLLGVAEPSSLQLVILDLDAWAAAASAAMDGFEVALRIRELSNTCWLMVLVTVAASGVDDGVRDMCRRAGVNGLIQKPVSLLALGAQLQRVLQNN
ncbi:hypothetical protein U9M48_025220 [Paspalum notatum var. saurae]|uniref:histidine kinase n=1 Tax=Paspalum notatum var. saurae TaxID=547442 RepID=A0AAQ3TUH6_PASNO